MRTAARPAMMRIGSVAVAAILAGFLAVQGGCGEEEAGPPPIRIGVVLPLTGQRASYGRDALNGILAAVDAINRDGGPRARKIDLVISDNHSRPEDSVRAVETFDEQGVVAIVGPLASRNAMAASRAAEERSIPIVLPAATLMGATAAGEYVSRICFTNKFQARVLAHFARDFLRAKTFAVVTESGSSYSRELAQFFMEGVEAGGGKVVWAGEYRSRQETFPDLIEALLARPVDVVFLPGYYAEVRAFLEESRARGLETPILGGDGWDVPYVVDSPWTCQSDNYFAAHFGPDEPTEAVAEFTAAYSTKYGYPPHSLAALGYDAIAFLSDALGRAPGGSREDLKNAINSTRGFRGLTGTLSLDAHRDAIKSAVILKTSPEGFEFIERVEPRSIAGADTLASPSRVKSLSS